MRNVWTICRRELYSYFVSPIAWVLLTIFAFLSGAFTYIITASFVRASLEGQMTGQSFPMNVNEQVIRPLFSNVAVIGLFLIPLISMRLFAEEKRQGTIELLVTSPVHDLEIVLGKWLSAVIMYSALLLVLLLDYSFLFIYGQPDWKPVVTGFLGVSTTRCMPVGSRDIDLDYHQKSNSCRRGRLRPRVAAMDPGLDNVFW